MVFFNIETYEIKRKLVFLGMMGAGKTSIGSLVAQKLNLNFIDIDSEIEKILGKSIIEILKTKVKVFLENLRKNLIKNVKIKFWNNIFRWRCFYE